MELKAQSAAFDQQLRATLPRLNSKQTGLLKYNLVNREILVIMVITGYYGDDDDDEGDDHTIH